nr:FAD-dependent oxidoreductase [Brevibacterium sp. 91QC2O2]
MSQTRERLEGDVYADVVIVGGGYTGLWTAYWLKTYDPGLKIVILEQEYVGFGASGRNGGWISGKTVGMRKNLERPGASHDDLLAMERECFNAAFEVEELMRAHGKDIDAHRGGWMQIARTQAELARLRHHLAEDREWGLTEDEVRLLSASETSTRINSPGVTGALYSPYAVKCNPAKLVYAVAELCEDLGVIIYENTRVDSIDQGDCRTSRGHAHGKSVVMAVEGYTAAMPGLKRSLLPMISSMIVTEPLGQEQWDEIGWSGYECISGAQHVYFYAQRTADDRIALGGRGRPYFWNSQTDKNGEMDSGTIDLLEEITRDLFPSVPMQFAHAWRGILGVPRDWSPFIDVDANNHLVRAGGYAGQGVTASYVAGRAVAQILSDYDEQPNPTWVRRAPRSWEPEPLRWVGTRVVQALYSGADKVEHKRGGTQTSILGLAANVVSGR